MPAKFRQAGLYRPAMMVTDLTRAFILLMQNDSTGVERPATDYKVQLRYDATDTAKRFMGENFCLE